MDFFGGSPIISTIVFGGLCWGPPIWASPENPMKAFLYKTTTDGLKDLPRKVAMVRAKGTLDFAKGVS